MKVLLLEDDSMLADILLHHLRESNQVIHVSDGESALEIANTGKFDLMILDINVPKLNGIEVLREIRYYNKTTPIILITAYQDTLHLKKGFESGCDDYIKKPFDLEELDLRINNIKKRFNIENGDKIIICESTYILQSKNLLVANKKEFHLAKKEIEILLYLFNRKQKVISSCELMQNIWQFEDMPSDATIRVYIKNLRSIIGKDKIRTIRGSGYYFE